MLLKIYNFLIAQVGRKHGAFVRMGYMEKTAESSAIPSYEVALPSYMAIVSIALNLFILLSNTIVLITFGKYKKHKVQHYCMIALVGTDLTVLVQNTALAEILIKQEIRLTTQVCDILASLASCTVTMTAMIHVCMSIDRWISVFHPIKYRTLCIVEPLESLQLLL